MANNQNLKPWPKGTSGNPKGRPKGSKNFKTILRHMLHDETLAKHLEGFMSLEVPYGDYVERKDAAHLMLAALIQQAARGNIKAIDRVMEIAKLEELEDEPVDEQKEEQIS